MSTPKKFGLLMQVFMSIIPSVALSILLPLLATGGVTFLVFLEGFGVSYVISLAVGLILPLIKWGDGLAAACNTKVGSFLGRLISTAVQTIIFVTILTLAMVAYNIGFPPYFFAAWLKFYPLALAIVYVLNILSAPLFLMLTKKILHIPETQVNS